MLDQRQLPTAVVTANDLMALGAMQEFKAAGLKIPHDISVVGFDDISFAALTDPPLTTICLPRMELGRRAVEALMTSIEHPDSQGVEIQIPTYLVIRGSTAPARTIHAAKSEGARKTAGRKKKKSESSSRSKAKSRKQTKAH
jgi:LacI family repressor for deo operon, udp, cdd, tsx, nupC, and nupG